jgi:hypothetical protein
MSVSCRVLTLSPQLLLECAKRRSQRNDLLHSQVPFSRPTPFLLCFRMVITISSASAWSSLSAAPLISPSSRLDKLHHSWLLLAIHSVTLLNPTHRRCPGNVVSLFCCCLPPPPPPLTPPPQRNVLVFVPWFALHHAGPYNVCTAIFCFVAIARVRTALVQAMLSGTTPCQEAFWAIPPPASAACQRGAQLT